MGRIVQFLIGGALIAFAFVLFAQINPDVEPRWNDVLGPLAFIAVGFAFLLKGWLNQPKADEDLEEVLAAIPFADGTVPTKAPTGSASNAEATDETPESGGMKSAVFALIFAVLFVISLGLMAALLAQNGQNLFAPEMRMMLFAALAAAAYVSWRVGRIVSRRIDVSKVVPRGNVGAGVGPISGMAAFRGGRSGSATTRARRARVEAKRRRLISEGKLEGEPVPPVPGEAPVRVAKTAPIKDRMAAREERVRRAKEQGKLD